MNIVLLQIGSHEYESIERIDVEAPFTPHLSIGYLKTYAEKCHNDLSITLIESWEIQGLKTEDIAAKIISYSPKVIGFSSYLCNIDKTKQTASICKKLDPTVIIIAGGPEIFNIEHMENHCFDYGVRGMGEKAFAQFIHYVKNNIPLTSVGGIMYRDNGKVYCNSLSLEPIDINEIPSPYLGGVYDLSKYKHAYLETFRGCPFHCSYCFFHKQYNNLTYFREERIKEELLVLRRHGVRFIVVLDSNFNMPKWGEKMCETIAGVNSDKYMEFSADIHNDFVSENFCKQAKLANFVEFQMGIQTVNRKVSDAIGRRFDPERFRKNIQILEDYKFRVNFDIIVGLPGDTPDDVFQAIDYAKSLPISESAIRVIKLRVLPGTTLWEEHLNYGIHFNPQNTYFIDYTPTFSAEFLEEFFNNCPGGVKVF